MKHEAAISIPAADPINNPAIPAIKIIICDSIISNNPWTLPAATQKIAHFTLGT
jgi:hypothetical protein